MTKQHTAPHRTTQMATLMALALSATLQATTTVQWTASIGGTEYVKEDGTEGVTLARHTGRINGHLDIPTAIEHAGRKHWVRSIAPDVFRGQTGITGITLGDSILEIGKGAFYGCTGIKEVTLPQFAARAIGDSAFAHSGIRRVIQKGDFINGDNMGRAFAGCSSFTDEGNTYLLCSHSALADTMNVWLMQGNKEIVGDLELDHNEYLGRDYHVARICEGAFKGARYVTNLFLSDTTTRMECIEAEAFMNCTNLKTTGETASVIIGDRAFMGCTALQSVDIGTRTRQMGSAVFMDCEQLKVVFYKMPALNVPDSTFMNCRQLQRIFMPMSATRIGKAALKNCHNLEFVQLFPMCQHIGEEAFMNCYNLQTLVMPDRLTSIGARAFKGCFNLDEIRRLELPDTRKDWTIGEEAFAGCERLEMFPFFPGERVNAGRKAFLGCKTVEVDGISYFMLRPDYAFVTSVAKTLPSPVLNFTGEVEHSVKITRKYSKNIRFQVVGIAPGAFSQCENLQEVVWAPVNDTLCPDFSGCKSLKKITFANQCRTLNAGAMKNCTALGEVYLPVSLSSIEDNAFEGCSALKSISLPGSLKSIGQKAFAGTALKKVKLPNALERISATAFDGTPAAQKMKYRDGVEITE